MFDGAALNATACMIHQPDVTRVTAMSPWS
jgi:hypothetical protein